MSFRGNQSVIDAYNDREKQKVRDARRRERAVMVRSARSNRVSRIQKLKEHYMEWFPSYPDGTLFRIYDTEDDKFIKETGNEGSYVMSIDTICDVLANMSKKAISQVMVIKDTENLDMTNPIFIGAEDAK